MVKGVCLDVTVTFLGFNLLGCCIGIISYVQRLFDGTLWMFAFNPKILVSLMEGHFLGILGFGAQ